MDLGMGIEALMNNLVNNVPARQETRMLNWSDVGQTQAPVPAAQLAGVRK